MSVPLNEKLWQFALEVYGVEGVAAECLAIQASHDVDVCLLLATGVAAREGLSPDLAIVRQWDAAVADWRQTCIKPLRKVRQDLKSQASDSPDVADLRRAELAAELQAERRELNMLAEEIAVLAGNSGSSGLDDDDRVRAALAALLSVFGADVAAMPMLLGAMCRPRT